MDRRLRPACLVSYLLLLAACSGSEDDSELARDASAVASEGADDASASLSGDAGPPRDGGGTPDAATSIDAGSQAADASRPSDAASGLDARATEAGHDASVDAAASEAGSADAARPDAALADAGAAPFERAFHVPVRVHRADSALTGAVIARIFEEVNEIWWKQAAICFEVEVVSSAELRSDGFDFFFHRSMLGCGASDSNGVYCGDHDIHSLDAPSLSPADNPSWDTRQNPARTSAHELGHGLRLEHYNGFADSNDSLMSSGRQGFKLHDSEITTARARAQMKALTSSTSAPCAPVPVAP
jgi:hypothetical protein